MTHNLCNAPAIIGRQPSVDGKRGFLIDRKFENHHSMVLKPHWLYLARDVGRNDVSLKDVPIYRRLKSYAQTAL